VWGRAWDCLCGKEDTDGCWNDELCCRQLIQEFGGDCGVHCSEFETCYGCNPCDSIVLMDGRKASTCEILADQLREKGVVCDQ